MKTSKIYPLFRDLLLFLLASEFSVIFLLTFLRLFQLAPENITAVASYLPVIIVHQAAILLGLFSDCREVCMA